MSSIATLIRDTRGQDMAEYGIALSVIAAGTVMIAMIIDGPILQLWQNATTVIAPVLAAV
ncbi:MAG TPA: hypothetical protein VEB21_18230 [Terriglobales bacterium]|nr:hypothetical protein [Terriglobales bacterium]